MHTLLMFSSNDDQIIWQINSRKIENHKIQMCLYLIENRILEEQKAKAKEPKSDTQKICILLQCSPCRICLQILWVSLFINLHSRTRRSMARKGAINPNLQKVAAGDSKQSGAWFQVHGRAELFAFKSSGVRLAG